MHGYARCRHTRGRDLVTQLLHVAQVAVLNKHKVGT